MSDVVEIREIEVKSPIHGLNIGDELRYDGQYINGYEEGSSPITRFFKEVSFINGVESCNYNIPVSAELSNGKHILIGFLDKDDNIFTMSKRIKELFA